MIGPIIRAWAKSGSKARLVVLVYHKVLPVNLPGSCDGICGDVLRTQLEWLSRHYKVVSLVEGIELCQAGELARPTACITFDDGYSTHATIAAPILKELGLPATFFVTSGHIGNKLLWNDRLQVFIKNATQQQKADYTELLHSLHGEPNKPLSEPSIEQKTKYLAIDRRREALDFIESVIPDTTTPIMMSKREIALLASEGFDIGAHTVDHPILALESLEFVESQIANDMEALSSITGKKVFTFAFPNGKPAVDYGYEHIAILRNLGIKVAAISALGHYSPACDPLQVPRVVFEGKNSRAFLRSIRRAYVAGSIELVSEQE